MKNIKEKMKMIIVMMNVIVMIIAREIMNEIVVEMKMKQDIN